MDVIKQSSMLVVHDALLPEMDIAPAGFARIGYHGVL